nr:hypothetical protein [uncultured Moraxella sp.]
MGYFNKFLPKNLFRFAKILEKKMGFRRYERLGMEILVGLAIAFIFPCYVFFSVSRKKEGIICLILQLTFLLAPIAIIWGIWGVFTYHRQATLKRFSEDDEWL